MIRNILLLSLMIICSACSKPEVADFINTASNTHYQKFDRYGKVMDDKAGPWQCVLDPNSGLLWENKTDDDGVHHYGWTYTWYEADQSREERESLFRDGSCESSRKGSCTTLGFIDKANREKLCGKTHWRLPTRHELESIIDRSRKEQLPLIATGIFSHTKTSSYWTSSKDENGETIYAVNFLDGSGGYFARKGAFYVRLVHDAD